MHGIFLPHGAASLQHRRAKCPPSGRMPAGRPSEADAELSASRTPW
ncbi:hypothetical protein BF49_6345 [Bradyrhizobium sp.]|nr:hypothetical protein BF49_6345 [Bradyrhizobium sp.]